MFWETRRQCLLQSLTKQATYVFLRPWRRVHSGDELSSELLPTTAVSLQSDSVTKHTHTRKDNTTKYSLYIHLLFRDRQRDRNTWQLTYLSRLVLSLSRCNPSLRFHPHLPAIQPGQEKANPNLLAAFHFVFVIYSSLFIKPSWTGIKKKNDQQAQWFPSKHKASWSCLSLTVLNKDERGRKK